MQVADGCADQKCDLVNIGPTCFKASESKPGKLETSLQSMIVFASFTY